MHYPVTDDKDNISHYHVRRPDDCFPKNSETLRNMFEKYNVDIVFNGHTHYSYDKIISGIRYVTIPGFSEKINGESALEFGIFDGNELKIEKL